MAFIKKTNPLSEKNAQIAQLTAQVRFLESQVGVAQAEAAAAIAANESAQEDCPDCEDIHALKAAVDTCNYELKEAERIINEEMCGNYFPQKFKTNNLMKGFKLAGELLNAEIADRDHDLAIAIYNLAYCKANGSLEYMEAKREELQNFIDANPDMDKGCLAQLKKIIALSE